MTEQYIWNYFKQRGFNDFGVAGLMGNLFAESALNPKNLQQTYEKKLGFTDDSYTEAVDNNTYTNFVYDKAGYGLAQWTYYSRKQGLLDFAKNNSKSIGDLDIQLEYLWYELKTMYKSVVNTLKAATSVLEASNAVLLDFERPANQSVEAQNRRASYGQKYYDKYALKEDLNMQTISPLATHVQISPNKSNRRNDIDTVTIHCVVGQCTVEALGNLFAEPERQASSNYGVGLDGRIGCYAPEEYRAWTSGGRDRNGNEIFVNGISGSMNDHRAITIEVASDTYHPYAVTDAAYEGLIDLLVDICKRNPKIGRLRWMNDKNLVGQIDLQNMTAHRWFANKECPGDYLYERFGDIAAKVNKRIDAENATEQNVQNNVQNVVEEEEDMTVERFKELFDEMRAEFRDNDSGEWSKAARAWATSTGLIQGGSATEFNGMWEDLLTREQLVTVLFRFAQMIGKA
jgi:N-acetyl-anhydromuramyl-L-alanine amidase AmpD